MISDSNLSGKASGVNKNNKDHVCVFVHNSLRNIFLIWTWKRTNKDSRRFLGPKEGYRGKWRNNFDWYICVCIWNCEITIVNHYSFFSGWLFDTVGDRYTAVRYDTIFYSALQWPRHYMIVCTHKRHPISNPNERAIMGCQLCWFSRKLTAL